MKILTYIALLIVAVVGVTFASLNAESVVFNYYFASKQFPLSLLLVLFFVAGSLFGLFFGILMYFKARHQIRQLKKCIKLAEKEIESLHSTQFDNRY
jgi:putative membrane protein